MNLITAYEIDPIHLPTPAGSANVDLLDSTIVGIEVGDLLLYDRTNSYVKSANTAAWVAGVAPYITTYASQAASDLAHSQGLFASEFVGIAAGRVDKYDVAGIRPVITQGVVNLPCASASFKHGDMLGVAKQSGNALHRNKVVAVTDPALCIARVYGDQSSVTTVRCVLMPRRLGCNPNPFGVIRDTTFYVTDTIGNIVTDFRFGRRCALLEAIFVSAVIQASADKTITFKKNTGTVASQTLTSALTTVPSGGLVIPTSGAAVGRVHVCRFDPTAADNQFDFNDMLNVIDDGGGTGGGSLIIRTMDMV